MERELQNTTLELDFLIGKAILQFYLLYEHEKRMPTCVLLLRHPPHHDPRVMFRE
jgi:hypothetical protein